MKARKFEMSHSAEKGSLSFYNTSRIFRPTKSRSVNKIPQVFPTNNKKTLPPSQKTSENQKKHVEKIVGKFFRNFLKSFSVSRIVPKNLRCSGPSMLATQNALFVLRIEGGGFVRKNPKKSTCRKKSPIYSIYLLKREREKLISPLPRGGRRISSSAFQSRRPFGYYLPKASYGTIFAATSGQVIVDLKLWFQSDLLKVTKV